MFSLLDLNAKFLEDLRFDKCRFINLLLYILYSEVLKRFFFEPQSYT